MVNNHIEVYKELVCGGSPVVAGRNQTASGRAVDDFVLQFFLQLLQAPLHLLRLLKDLEEVRHCPLGNRSATAS